MPATVLVAGEATAWKNASAHPHVAASRGRRRSRPSMCTKHLEMFISIEHNWSCPLLYHTLMHYMPASYQTQGHGLHGRESTMATASSRFMRTRGPASLRHWCHASPSSSDTHACTCGLRLAVSRSRRHRIRDCTFDPSMSFHLGIRYNILQW